MAKKKTRRVRRRRSNPSKRLVSRPTRRVRRRRSNPSFFASATPRRRRRRPAHQRRRIVRRRRRNPSVPWSDLLIAIGSGAAGLLAMYLANTKGIIPESIKSDPKKSSLLSAGAAIGAGALLFGKSPAAAMGVTAGVGSFAVYNLLASSYNAPAPAASTPATTPAALGALMARSDLGALEPVNGIAMLGALEPVNGIATLNGLTPVPTPRRLGGLEDLTTVRLGEIDDDDAFVPRRLMNC